MVLFALRGFFKTTLGLFYSPFLLDISVAMNRINLENQ